MGGAAPPGWYPESETHLLRWWDGEHWTEWHQQPRTAGLWPPPDQASLADHSHGSGLPTHEPERTNGGRLWIIGVVAAAILLVGAGVAAYTLGHQASSSAGRVPTGSGGGFAVAGAPGYTTVRGPDGIPLAQGRPWGTACMPIVFWVDKDVPASIYAQANQVVSQARAQGVDVGLQSRQGIWHPGQLYPAGLTNAQVRFVEISADDGTPPILTNGQPEHINFGWDTRSLGNVDALSDLQVTIYLQSVGNDTVKIRRALRQMVAFAEGVGNSEAPHTGISDNTSANILTTSDLRAIRLMSGCRPPGS